MHLLHILFVDQPHKDYVRKMSATAHMGNMDQVLQGFHSLPRPYNKENGLEIKMWNLNGTITTPWFGEDFVEEYYKEDREFHIVLELPGDIKDQVGNGSLIIELEVDTRVETGWIEDVFMFTYNYTLHRTSKNWFEADAECQRGGGHLASAASEGF